jgi:hypothetical protein
LEALSQDRAVDEIRRAWASLTDKEVALVLAPYVDGRQEELTPEERAPAEKMRAFVPEELIAVAIGLEGRMESEEIGHRIKDLVGRLGVFERGNSIRWHLRAVREGTLREGRR